MWRHHKPRTSVTWHGRCIVTWSTHVISTQVITAAAAALYSSRRSQLRRCSPPLSRASSPPLHFLLALTSPIPYSAFSHPTSFSSFSLCLLCPFSSTSSVFIHLLSLLFSAPKYHVFHNVHGLSMACWKACGRLPISANWTYFASSHGWGAMSKYWSKLRRLKGRWVTLSANFRGKGVVHQRILA